MADKSHDKRPEPAPAPSGGDKKASGGLLQKTPVVMGAVMIVEAFVLFAGFKILGGSPKQAVAIELSTGEKGVDGKGIDAGSNKRKLIEINIVDFKADRKSTRLNSSHLVISYAVF